MPVNRLPFFQNGAASTYRAPTVVRSLSQEEAIMLVRSELKRMGLSDKISRYVYKKYHM